jgi:hypothetical protein
MRNQLFCTLWGKNGAVKCCGLRCLLHAWEFHVPSGVIPPSHALKRKTQMALRLTL